MVQYREVLQRIQADPLYLSNLSWGRPRSGHPEGTLQAHIEQLEANLERIAPELVFPEIDQLRILVHVHDICKPQAATGVLSSDPGNHGYMAREFLQQYCEDRVLLAITQHHDDGYMLYNYCRGDKDLSERLLALFEAVIEPELFLLFACVDGCTEGKFARPLTWFLDASATVIPVSERVFRCHARLRC
jgi:hypothetical protein